MGSEEALRVFCERFHGSLCRRADALFELTDAILSAGSVPSPPHLSLLNAIFYLLRSGCQWRMLPREFPPWSTVHHYFRMWRLDGTWEKVNALLRERLRLRAGRDPQPSAGILDTQSVKTTSVGGVRGYDGAKKLRVRANRKRV